MHADVAIAGASFAGLGAAYYLKGTGIKVLLIGRKGIGENRASTCAMPLYIAEELAPGSILAVQGRFNIETRRINKELGIPGNYCTVDYKKFCASLFKNSGADFLKAEVRGTANNAVETSAGRVDAGFILDCTGWRRTLSAGGPARPQELFIGMEVTTRIRKEHEGRLSFFVDRGLIPGYGWIFPVGGGLGRVGLGGRCTSVPLRKAFMEFLSRIDIPFENRELVAGAIPATGLGRAYYKGVFFVGDSAGQVLPLGGEGIRTSLYFARECAAALAGVHEGKLTRDECIRLYERKVNAERFAFSTLRMIQESAFSLPQLFFDSCVFAATSGLLAKRLTNAYLSIARL
ncbi:MAG: NAD(P)/FAD-dependent oxidoreductase [Candidatus Micrarchaeota archaeon]